VTFKQICDQIINYQSWMRCETIQQRMSHLYDLQHVCMILSIFVPFLVYLYDIPHVCMAFSISEWPSAYLYGLQPICTTFSIFVTVYMFVWPSVYLYDLQHLCVWHSKCLYGRDHLDTVFRIQCLNDLFFMICCTTFSIFTKIFSIFYLYNLQHNLYNLQHNCITFNIFVWLSTL